MKCDDERAVEVIDEFNRTTNFPNVGRKWTTEGLCKGQGYLELGGSDGVQGIKLLDAKNMYIKRDEQGKISAFNQLIKGFQRDKINDKMKLQKSTDGKNGDYIEFDPKQIALFQVNQIGDRAYGVGMIYPNLDTIDNYLGACKNMHTVMKRKAGTPYDITLGSLEHNIFPEPSAVSDMGQKLEYLQNKTEWVHGPDVVIKPLDFGNIAEKFVFPMEHDMDQVMMGFQTPKTVSGQEMSTGLGSGLSKEHGGAFQRFIESIQEELEKVIEQNIYKRVLLAQGIDAHVEIVWGLPSEEEKRAQIELLRNLLISISNPAIRLEMEKDLAQLMDYDKSIVDVGDAQRQADADKQQAADSEEKPEDKKKNPFLFSKLTRWWKGKDMHKHEEDFGKDHTLIEWVGFNYSSFLQDIKKVIRRDSFADLAAANQAEIDAGYLNKVQIIKLKETLTEAFMRGYSMHTLASTFVAQDIISDLYQMTDGERTLLLDKATRSIMVARTETIRLSALGNLTNYEDAGLTQVRFSAAFSERTCEECAFLNGHIYDIAEAFSRIPVHPNCRCRWLPIVGG